MADVLPELDEKMRRLLVQDWFWSHQHVAHEARVGKDRLGVALRGNKNTICSRI